MGGEACCSTQRLELALLLLASVGLSCGMIPIMLDAPGYDAE